MYKFILTFSIYFFWQLLIKNMFSIGLLGKVWNFFEDISFAIDLIRKYFGYQSNEIIDWKSKSFLAGFVVCAASCFVLVIVGFVSYYTLHTNQQIKRNPETENKQDNDENKNILNSEQKTTIRISGENLMKESNFWKSLNTQFKPNVEINLSENGELVITQKYPNLKLDAIEKKVLRSAYKSPNLTNQPDIPVSGQPSSCAHCEQQTVDKKVIENAKNQSDLPLAAQLSSDTAPDQQTANEKGIQNQENQPDDHVSTRPSSSRAFQDKTSDLKME